MAAASLPYYPFRPTASVSWDVENFFAGVLHEAIRNLHQGHMRVLKDMGLDPKTGLGLSVPNTATICRSSVKGTLSQLNSHLNLVTTFTQNHNTHLQAIEFLHSLSLSLGYLPGFWNLDLTVLHRIDEVLLSMLIKVSSSSWLKRKRLTDLVHARFRALSASIEAVKRTLPDGRLFKREYCLRSFQYLQDFLRSSEAPHARSVLQRTNLPFELVEMVLAFLLGDLPTLKTPLEKIYRPWLDIPVCFTTGNMTGWRAFSTSLCWSIRNRAFVRQYPDGAYLMVIPDRSASEPAVEIWASTSPNEHAMRTVNLWRSREQAPFADEVLLDEEQMKEKGFKTKDLFW